MGEIILDIKKELAERKEKSIYELVKAKKKSNSHFKPTDLRLKLKNEIEGAKIKTGTLIDEMIGGGIPEGKSMMLYGEYGSAKTQTCFTSAVLCPNRVIYIDTEGTFRVTRIKEMCEVRELDFDTIIDKIDLYEPANWVDQMFLLYDLPSPADVNGKVDLIICDSVSKLFRGVEFIGRENLQVKNGMIREFILFCEDIAKLHKAAFIYTTQIYDKPISGAFVGPAQIQQPVGGRGIQHQGDFVIFIRKGTGNIRVARMMDSSWNALAERSFLITAAGITDIPEGAKAHTAEENRIKKFEKTQEQEKIKPKKKKKKDDEEETSEQNSEELTTEAT